MSKKPTVLMILDGYGLRDKEEEKCGGRGQDSCHGQADG